MASKNLILIIIGLLLGASLIGIFIQKQLSTEEISPSSVLNEKELMTIPEGFMIYQDYLDVIGGKTFSEKDIVVIEATVLSITKNEICPDTVDPLGPEPSDCSIEPYPNDFGMLKIDKIIEYTNYLEQTDEYPIEGRGPQVQEEIVKSSGFAGVSEYPSSKRELNPLHEGQKVEAKFLLTARSAKSRYVQIENSEAQSVVLESQDISELDEDVTTHQPDQYKKVYKPIPKEDDYFVFTTDFGREFTGELPYKDKTLPGLNVGDRFYAKVHYDGMVYIKEYETELCYFSEDIEQPDDCPGQNCKILVIVESEIYQDLEESLSVFSNDLRNDLGYDIKIEQLPRRSDETDVKNIILNEYNSGKLKGVFLVGRVPTARIPFATPGYYTISDQKYYQDVFNRCVHNITDDSYSNCTIPWPFHPPFWVSRIIAPLDVEIENYPDGWTDGGIKDYIRQLKETGYFLGQNMDDDSSFYIGDYQYYYDKIILPSSDVDRINKIKHFFEINHLYRINQLPTIKEAINYIPILNQDPNPELTKQNLINSYKDAGYDESEIHIINSGVDKNEEYFEYIKKPYEFLFVNAHGGSSIHEYNVTTDNLNESNPLIIEPNSCSVGDFRDPSFIVGHYLTSGKTQHLKAASLPTFTSTAIDLGHMKSLLTGKRICEAWDFNPVSHNWFGDPTLVMRKEPFIVKNSGPKICFSRRSLDFGEVTEPKILELKFYNRGKDILRLYPNYVLHPKWLSFNENYIVGKYPSWISVAGGSKNLNITNDGSFERREITIIPYDLNPGEYEGYFYLVSNDEDYPIMKFPISFEIPE